ncbi:hypothetical protein C8J57DRAFT_1523288 [Mycena rebaudengoi]|nr:hypothetical protein C8J57DRAFT_1523288 [Mycena rebaudengoi]
MASDAACSKYDAAFTTLDAALTTLDAALKILDAVDATLTHYALPDSGNYDVILDPIQFGFLRIRTILPGDVRALARAWLKGANTAIKMVDHDTGNVPTVDAGGSASGYRARRANWNGSGNGSGSGTPHAIISPATSRE